MPARASPSPMPASPSVRLTTKATRPTSVSRRGRRTPTGCSPPPVCAGQTSTANGVEAFASAPGRRYALTGNNNWWYGGQRRRQPGRDQGLRLHRPTRLPPEADGVFPGTARPAQGRRGLRAAGRRPGHHHRHRPEGEQVYSGTLTSSQFGTVNGSFPLPTGAALGEYHVSVTIPNVAGVGQRQRRQSVPCGGIQEAGVRGQSHAVCHPGPLRGHGDGDGERHLLLRRTRRRGQSLLQGLPQPVLPTIPFPGAV